MTTTGLFGREVELDIGLPGTTGIQITDLHVAWHIQHKMTGKPSNAKIKVWNPAPTTIFALQQAGCEVILKVGYATGGPVRQIFQGNVVRGGVKEERQGPDRIITIEAHDGGDVIAASYISTSLSAQVTFAQAVAACIATMSKLPVSRMDLGGNDKIVFPNGVVLVGPTRQKLSQLLSAIACTWNIRDGAMQILPVGGSTAATAVVFSADAGNLIGTPSPKGPGPSTTSTGYPAGSIEVKALCEPSLRPGDPFEVQSELISGLYIARDVVFEGDSGYEQPFYVIAIGAPPGAPFVGEGNGAVQSEAPSLGDVVHDHVTARLADVHTTMPGVVLAYDALKQTATVQPTTPQIQRDAQTGALVPFLLPPLGNVPVVFPGAAAGGLTFPLANGDPGILLFCERSIDNWKNTGQSATTLQDPARQFNFTDAVFLPGNSSAAKALSLDKIDTSAAVIWARTLLKLGDAGADQSAVLGDTYDSQLGTFLTALGLLVDALATGNLVTIAGAAVTFNTPAVGPLPVFQTQVADGSHLSELVKVSV